MVDFIAEMLDEWQATRDALRELERREARFKYPDIIDKYGRRWWFSSEFHEYQHDCMVYPKWLVTSKSPSAMITRELLSDQLDLPNVEALYKGKLGLRNDSYQWLGAAQPTLPGMPLKSGEHCHYCLVELGARDE